MKLPKNIQKLLGFFRQSSIIRGFGCLLFDWIIVRNKQFLTYIIVVDKSLDSDSFKIPVAAFKAWDLSREIFGPIPLSIVYFQNEKILARRLSPDWASEYVDFETYKLVPAEGLTELKL